VIFEDFHTHNRLCRHAEGTIEDYVKSAIDKKLTTIGISDHFPYEFYKNLEGIPHEEYGMKLREIKGYLLTIQQLKDKYEEQINVRSAFEIDFIPNQINKLNQHLNTLKPQLDYILGSIHILFTENGAWSFDDSRFLDEFEKYKNVDNVYIHYYNSIINMVNNKAFDFDIVSHLDLPKKFNKFPEHPDIIMDKVLEVLNCIKKRDLVIEVNTSGFRKEVKEQYPSIEIIRNIFELDIPIVLSSDAHRPKEIAWRFDDMLDKLKKIGFSKLAHFKGRKRSYIDIE
jgi:histidinol-phosphatase (PHP family)